MNRKSFTILTFLSICWFFPESGRSVNTHLLNPQQANNATIQSFAWHDFDKDGLQDMGEKGLEGLRVLLFDQLDNFVGIQFTNVNGTVSFSGITPGTYRLKFPVVQGLTFTGKDKGPDGSDSDLFTSGYTDYFFVGPNQTITHFDAGYHGSLQVYLGSSIQACSGSEVELSASVFHGKGPYSFQWNQGLGTGAIKIVDPTITTIYSVTATDSWGSTASTMIIVRVKNGLGEEQCHIIDDFVSDGNTNQVSIEVSPADPGPKTVIETSVEGLLGNTREIVFEHVSGNQPANLILDYEAGMFTSSNDVGTVSQSRLCYNDNKQGVNFDLGAFDYFKFSQIEVDQGGINMIVAISDGSNEVSIDRKLPGLGTATVFDNELPLEFIPGINNINLSQVQEVCFAFYTSTPSVDFSLESIAACRTTDCQLEMSPDLDICQGETVTISAISPCSDQVIYYWDNNLGSGPSHEVTPAQTTTYSVIVTDQDGCVAMGEVTVTVHPVPAVSLGPDLELCAGEAFTLTALGTGGTPPYEFSWSHGPADESQYAGIATENREIFVTITDSRGCENSDQLILTVHENPTVETRSTLADCGIADGTATAEAGNGTPPYDYSWSNGESGSEITGLFPGIYTVTVTDLNGCSIEQPVQVMEKHCGMIGDRVWLDDNGNGLQDATEPGVPGVQVILLDEFLNSLDTTLSLGNGYYAFNNLAPSNYHILFILPENHLFTSPNQGQDSIDSDADAMTGVTPVITIDSMEQNLTIDAGIYQTASIGNLVWLDTNGNGLQDPGENGVPNVPVTLRNCNQQIYGQTTTGEQGEYLFTNLKPGPYSLVFQLPEGMAFTVPSAGNDPAVDSDPDPQNGTTTCEWLTSGEHNHSYDAGIYQPASVGDFVWHDLNANGIQDSGEPGIANVGVILQDCSGNQLATQTTNSQGYFLFNGLNPGNYQLGLSMPAGYELSPYNMGNGESNSDIDPSTNTSVCFNLVSAQQDPDRDIGLFRRAGMGDRVWEDTNGNGLQDTGEPGLPQVSVELFDCQNNLLETTATDAQGYYLFDELLPGSYSIHYVLPENHFFTAQQQGDNDSMDSDADPLSGFTRCEVLTSGENNVNFDAGLYRFATIGDLVWDDLDVDGIQDEYEPGVAGIKVVLEDCHGNRLDSIATDSQGFYQFGGLIPGQYVLNFSQNDEVYFTGKFAGNDPEKDSNVNPNSGKTGCFAVASNVVDLSNDAGLAYTADVGDWVWEDLNGNGVQDTGEPGVALVGVRLFRKEGITSYLYTETVTDNAGYYLFEDIAPGSYYIEFILPSGYEVTFPDSDQDLIDNDITHFNGMNTTDDFDLTPGIFKMDVDAGLYVCAQLGDLVWCDYTKNGYWDPDENGINGIDVLLYRQNNNGNWVLWEMTTTKWKSGSTCGDGYWDFCVIPGTYYIELNIPDQANLIAVDPNQGTNEEYDSDITHANGPQTTDVFSLVSQQIKTNMAGGYFYGAIIGDLIWNDINTNGIQDEGENGLNHVKIELFDSGGKIAETYSEPDGSYEFRHLLAGSFYIKVTAPDGMSFSPALSGNDATKDSDINGINGPGTSRWINLMIEEKNYTIDAGLYAPAPMQLPDQETSSFLYPNPSSGPLTISFVPAVSETLDILIQTMEGGFVREFRNVQAEKDHRLEFQEDLSDLPAGQYRLLIKGKNTRWESALTLVP
jgi:protocatechuate 3,4-dioxygenase beta subunit